MSAATIHYYMAVNEIEKGKIERRERGGRLQRKQERDQLHKSGQLLID